MRKATVLYIAGAGRSGSTLLEMLLGNAPNHFSIGEARHFFEYVPIAGKVCGCGHELIKCPFWSAVLDRLKHNPHVDLERAAHLSLAINRTRYTWQILANTTNRSWRDQADELTGYLEHLYEAIWQQSGRQIIVDSSKVPSHLLLLSQISFIDLRALHLIRDGRAVAYSWNKRRKKQETPTGAFVELPRRSILRSILTWMLENILTGRIGRRTPNYARLHYEGFAANPEIELEKTLNELGLRADISHMTNDEVNLGTNHSVGGNPLRFQQKQQKIVLDDTWRKEMRSFDKVLATTIAVPLLIQYGYPLR